METNHSKATRRTRLYLLLLCLTLAFACTTLLSSRSFGPVTAESNRATREERLAVFDDVWSTINRRYYDRDFQGLDWQAQRTTDRKSTRLNSSHSQISYAVFCLKKKKNK